MTDGDDPPLGPLGECAYCGSQFQLGIDYPVTTRRDGGELEIYSFCSRECQAAWEADN